MGRIPARPAGANASASGGQGLVSNISEWAAITIDIQLLGATYSGAIEPLIERHPELFDVLEIEPQTTWIKTADPERPLQADHRVLDHLAGLPGRKIIHSVGRPIGGTVAPEVAELDLLTDAISHLNAPWASDHLSFNQTSELATGFFLPPRQTPQVWKPRPSRSGGCKPR